MDEKQRQRLTGLRRYWVLALDSASRAKLTRNGGSPSEWIATLRSGSAIKVQKFLAGVHLINHAIPGFEEHCAKSLLDYSQLPFSDPDVRLIAAGLGQNVFVFQTAQGKMVLKIDRESQAMTSGELLYEAGRIKEEHEKIRGWYADIPGFIPCEMFAIVNGPLKGRPALATIQPFVEERLRGIFEDFTAADLAALIRTHEPLRKAFITFVSRLVSIYQSTGECIDLLGDRNLCIRGEDHNPGLFFLDPHDIYGPLRISRYPVRHGQLDDNIAYLERVCSMVVTR